MPEHGTHFQTRLCSHRVRVPQKHRSCSSDGHFSLGILYFYLLNLAMLARGQKKVDVEWETFYNGLISPHRRAPAFVMETWLPHLHPQVSSPGSGLSSFWGSQARGKERASGSRAEGTV